MSEYQKELIQVAAVAVAMIQMDRTGDTRRDLGSRQSVEDSILTAIRMERERQEKKWGTRHTKDCSPERWYTILGEEFGEVGKAILEAK